MIREPGDEASDNQLTKPGLYIEGLITPAVEALYQTAAQVCMDLLVVGTSISIQFEVFQSNPFLQRQSGPQTEMSQSEYWCSYCE